MVDVYLVCSPKDVKANFRFWKSVIVAEGVEVFVFLMVKPKKYAFLMPSGTIEIRDQKLKRLKFLDQKEYETLGLHEFFELPYSETANYLVDFDIETDKEIQQAIREGKEEVVIKPRIENPKLTEETKQGEEIYE